MGHARTGLSSGRQLYELQEVDLEIDDKREQLAQVTSRIGDSQALAAARSALAAEEERLAELERGQRDGERQTEDMQAKVTALEEKLYGGRVANPKELASIQEQVKHIRQHMKEQDDNTFDIMSKADDTERKMAALRNEAADIEREWRAEQAELSSEQAELTASLAALEQRREQMAARIEAATLELYHRLRQKRQGRAVAKLERGICQGCHIALPMSELQRARMGQELVQCSSCERILYVS